SGGPGRDALLGGAGTDGLLGGAGDQNTITGGDGPDRFLDRGNDTFTDRTSADAKLNFQDGDTVWSDDEIAQLDTGLHALVSRTGNTRFLKLSGGGEVTVQRYADLGTDTLADNTGDGRIRIADLTFADDEALATMVHELGHN